jgi:hypothetical protein
MATIARIERLLDYYYHTRGKGHTSLLLNGAAANTGGGFLLASRRSYAKQILREAGITGLVPIGWDCAYPEFNAAFYGRSGPVFLDNSAVMDILMDAVEIEKELQIEVQRVHTALGAKSKQIHDLEKRLEEFTDALFDCRYELADRSNQLKEAQANVGWKYYWNKIKKAIKR